MNEGDLMTPDTSQATCRFCGSRLSLGYKGRWYCTARGCWNCNHPVTENGVDIRQFGGEQ